MQITVELTGQVIACEDVRQAALCEEAGAIVEFTGTVRRLEQGAAIAGLEYEAYGEMAFPVIRRILTELGRIHPCLTAAVVHRVGFVPVGEAAICVVVTAVHRGEAFSLITAFMERLKADVPIWKVRAVPATNEREVTR